MNLEAVALAADSAVTAYPRGNPKIFSSQNKLFALSDAEPVGILIYGAASFMSIPWETLVKEYRRNGGKRTFDELSGYVEDFCGFLTNHIGDYISAEQGEAFAKSLVEEAYSEIDLQIRSRISEEFSSNFSEGSSFEDQFTSFREKAILDTVDEYYGRAQLAQLADGFTTDFVDDFGRKFRRLFREIRERIIAPGLGSATARKLNIIATKAIFAMQDDILANSSGPSTGIVVAGFGNKELFPSYSEMHVEGLIGGILKKRQLRLRQVGPDNRAIIVPFAQSEMVHEFMQGISPIYFQYLHESMISHLEEYTTTIIDSLDQYSDSDKAALQQTLRNLQPGIADEFVNQVNELGRGYLAKDIVDVVAMLPKDQLAEMAEALVRLTSLKRRVSPEGETVGGPTDVAIISKADGLIWIRRKQYFSPELNPRFMVRSYWGGEGHAAKNL